MTTRTTAGDSQADPEGFDAAGDWCTVEFGQLLTEPVRNGIYKAKEYRGRGAKIVNMGELFAFPRLGRVPMKRIEVTDSESSRFGIIAGDLIFARRSLVAEGAGKCSIVVATDGPTVFESSIIRARPNPVVTDSGFLYYYFNSPGCRRASGAGRHDRDWRSLASVQGCTSS